MDDEYYRACYPSHPDQSLFYELEQDSLQCTTVESYPHDYIYETPRYSIPLDDFDRELLKEPYDDRTSQATQGRARLTLPTVGARHTRDSEYTPQLTNPQRVSLSQFAYSPQDRGSNSSKKTLPSSPAYLAGKRRTQRQRSRNSLERNQKYRQSKESERKWDSHKIEFQDHLQGLRVRDLQANNIDRTSQTVQSIQLVSTHQLPDRFRSVFKFPVFNAVQSKCFDIVYRSKDNFVLSSPTGSGKTAVLELAVCQALMSFSVGDFKIVYQAPTKSLCSERQQDWQSKFGPLGLTCVELTGDTENGHIQGVKRAGIIITTPEKWDSITRKWKDHEKLMKMIKLFLIDEVHILGSDRGATLEAVVSRMKSVVSDIRFVALSATVPNFEDISTWLGRTPTDQHVPAHRERFGEEFRPVKLEKHVLGYAYRGNDWAFDKALTARLPETIRKFSHRKPIMIFCPTRASSVATAQELSRWWEGSKEADRYWNPPHHVVGVSNKDLQKCVTSAVAFHHAGIELADRQLIEKAYLNADINVICCTSTLATGINLPCHLVIIKNTVHWTGTHMKEYPDLEIMQMLGRAGRPQFGDSAIAVIMTTVEKKRTYEKMVSGQEVLESCLHINLVEHLNAEIGLGTVIDLQTAKRWLSGTFLAVRLKRNPENYRLPGDAGGRDVEARLERVCGSAITQLEDCGLITVNTGLLATEFGDAMARYCLQLETMKIMLGVRSKARPSEILTALAQAAEFKDVRFRSGDKPVYKDLNCSPSIKFPIPVNLELPAHKVSLIIQSVLGGVDLAVDDKTAKVKLQYNSDTALIFQHSNRIIRCFIDCQLHMKDSVAARNGLMLARSLAARVWDDSPLQLKQIEGIGPVAVRKLVNSNIKSIDELEHTEPQRIETILSKHPPFGLKILDKLKAFPKLRVSIHLQGKPKVVNEEYGVKITLKAEIGFLNETPPANFARKPMYVCLLAETSDGRVVHFCRVAAHHLSESKEVRFDALLQSMHQTVICSIMCDEIAGTLQNATYTPKIPASMFPLPKNEPENTRKEADIQQTERPILNMPRRKSEQQKQECGEEFDDNDIDWDMVNTTDKRDDPEFTHIDDVLDTDENTPAQHQDTENARSLTNNNNSLNQSPDQQQTGRLKNGRWPCRHPCKDKMKCRHLCCKDGCEKPPPMPKGTKGVNTARSEPIVMDGVTKSAKVQSKLVLPVARREKDTKSSIPLEIIELDMTEGPQPRRASNNSNAVTGQLLSEIRHSIPTRYSKRATIVERPSYSYNSGVNTRPSFLKPKISPHRVRIEELEQDVDKIECFTSEQDHETEDRDISLCVDRDAICDAGHVAETMCSEDDPELDAAMIEMIDFQEAGFGVGSSGKEVMVAEGSNDDNQSIYQDPSPKEVIEKINSRESTNRNETLKTDKTSLMDRSVKSSIVGFKRASELLSAEDKAALKRSRISKEPNSVSVCNSKENIGQGDDANGRFVTNAVITMTSNPGNPAIAASVGVETPSMPLTKENVSDKFSKPSHIEGISEWLLKEFGDVIEIV